MGKLTMRRWVAFLLCAILGTVLLVCGLVLPAHLRAVDARVLKEAGRNTPSLVDRGLTLVGQKNLGAAQLLLDSAQRGQTPRCDELKAAIDRQTQLEPKLRVWGAPLPELATGSDASPAAFEPMPMTDFVLRLENRDRILAHLENSPSSAVQELLRCRALTNTTLFPPARSSSGQAFDAAVSICGLLLEQHGLSEPLGKNIAVLAANANRGGSPQLLEQVLMDFLSLGQRFNWGQLTAFVEHIPDLTTLNAQTTLARKAGMQLPDLFSAVQLSGNPAAVADYLSTFSQTGLNDLAHSLQFGVGGVDELLRQTERLHLPANYDSAGAPGPFAAGMAQLSLRSPHWAVVLKCVAYFAAGFLLAFALHFARPAVSPLERPLQVRGFHVAREFLFALGFLVVVLLLSEPFITQESQKVALPFRLQLPTAGGAVPTGIKSTPQSFMSQTNLLSLLLFFVLQGLLYTACVLKLAEIRRQKVPARIRLKLLENEDHLFDAGLYLGFLGTIVSFILYSVGVVQQFSLMVAYSSTSFGIIFVSVFKICHLRPARRKLLMEAETAPAKPVATTTPSLVISP